MTPEILLLEDYPHPVAKVWTALTEPAALSQWLMATDDFEPRLGKRFKLHGRATPEWRGWMECEVLELDPPRRMVWSWRRSETEEPNRVEFRLDPIEGGTRLTLKHTGVADAGVRDRYTSGWPVKLAAIRTMLAASVQD